MSLGTAVLILGVLCLIVFSAGFRRFALWASAVAVAAMVGTFFYWWHVEQAQHDQECAAEAAAQAAHDNASGLHRPSRPDLVIPWPGGNYVGPCEDWRKTHQTR
jgi:hypothetical protein